MKKKIIVKTEEELKNLTIFDILHDVFGLTKPEFDDDSPADKDKDSPKEV